MNRVFLLLYTFDSSFEVLTLLKFVMFFFNLKLDIFECLCKTMTLQKVRNQLIDSENFTDLSKLNIDGLVLQRPMLFLLQRVIHND